MKSQDIPQIRISLKFMLSVMQFNTQSADRMRNGFQLQLSVQPFSLNCEGSTITVDNFCTSELLIPQDNCHVMEFQLAVQDKRLN